MLSLRPQLKRTKLTVKIHGDDDLCLDSYPGAFAQIVTNLVMNSLMHAYDPDDTGCLFFEVKRKGSRFIFKYSDDGKGIAKENLNKIFEPFFTTRRGRGGSGLGLHIIYNLVHQKFGGVIKCESEVGIGTKFKIELPLEPPKHRGS
jgi:signal transduction histidine kinase